VKRVYIDRLTGGETAAQMREILMSSLQASKLFVITENQETATRFSRRSGRPGITESRRSSEGVNAPHERREWPDGSSSRGAYGGWEWARVSPSIPRSSA